MTGVTITYKRPRGNTQNSPALSTYTLAYPDGTRWTGVFPDATERIAAATGADKLTIQDAIMTAWIQGEATVAPA